MPANPYSVRADKFYFREEELYVGLGHNHRISPDGDIRSKKKLLTTQGLGVD
jgi:hypothetical protein